MMELQVEIIFRLNTNFHIKTRVIIFPVIGDPMKFTKIITYFLFHLLIFTSSTDICKMAAYCFLGCTFDTWLYIFTYKTSLSQTHKPYFKHNKNSVTAF